jgi:copper ion binding protein
MKMKLKVEGMSCQHCVMATSQALFAVEGVEGVQIRLESKAVEVTGTNLLEDAIKEAIYEAGYDVVEVEVE